MDSRDDHWMNAKTLAAVAVFAALTSVVNLSPFKIAAPFATYLYYQIWEIPIVAAFLLYGPSMGITVAAINTVVLLLIFPGALPTGPLYNLAAILGMLIGIYVADRFSTRYFAKRKETFVTVFSTAVGILSRVGVMSLVNWAFLRYPYPVGFDIPEGALIVMLPAIGLFNATLALYTIPMGYILARAVSHGIKIDMWKKAR
jgi:riboflavin transporter FmnP